MKIPPQHELWKRIAMQLETYLDTTTIEDLANHNDEDQNMTDICFIFNGCKGVYRK